MTATASTSRRADDELVHAALLYRHPEQLRVALAEFLHDGHEAGDAMLVALPGDHLLTVGAILDEAPGSVVVQDMSEVGRNPARLIPMLRGWLHEQSVPARVVSEALWPGRSYAETTECLRHEALVNHALAAERVSILCPFDAAHLTADVLSGVELTHPHLIDDAGPRPSLAFGDPLEVARGGRWPQAEPVAPVAELEFDSDLWRLRHELADHPLLAELGSGRRADLVLAVDEAVGNAIRHGDGRARTRVWRDEDDLVAEVWTASRLDDPMAGRRVPGPEQAGGRGLWLINQLCDLVEVRSDDAGTGVRMHVSGKSPSR